MAYSYLARSASVLTVWLSGCSMPPPLHTATPTEVSPALVPWRTPACWYVCNADDDEAELAAGLPEGGAYDWSKAVFRLERRGCYGACPEYRVSIYPDGRVEYEGAEHVDVCGRRAWRVSGADRERLVNAFRNEQYLTADLERFQTEIVVTDQDSAITAVEIGGQRRVVWHYAPRVYGFGLTRLERLIDEVAGVRRWTSCTRTDCWCHPPGDRERRFLDDLAGTGSSP